MSFLDTSALGEKIGGRPGWQWALIGGAGLAVVFYLRSRGSGSAAAAPTMLNPALSLFGGGDGGGSGGGGGTTPPSSPPPTMGGDWNTCAAQYPVIGFARGSKGPGDWVGARPLAFWDCVFAGATSCAGLSGQARNYCNVLGTANYPGLGGLGGDGCLYFYNPLTGVKTKNDPTCGARQSAPGSASGTVGGSSAAAGANHDAFTPLSTASVHPAQITPGR